MVKKLIISILVFLISSKLLAEDQARQAPLRDGFPLTGIDGKLTGPDSNDSWFFEFDSDVTDNKGLIKAGQSLKLLPSAALEKMTDDMKNRPTTDYRLWATATKYNDTNFIFPIYFLPLTKPAAPAKKQQLSSPEVSLQTETQITETPNSTKSVAEKNPELQSELTINEPNDPLKMPQEIIAKLQTGRIATTEQPKQTPNAANDVQQDSVPETSQKIETPLPTKAPQLKPDSILADRTALLAANDDGQPVFVLDAIGRNLQQTSFRLLPCQALEHAQHKQSEEPDQLRFKIAGIVTNYKGQNYLLLQRAILIYSHQNFGR
jgi:hypothetical protein